LSGDCNRPLDGSELTEIDGWLSGAVRMQSSMTLFLFRLFRAELGMAAEKFQKELNMRRFCSVAVLAMIAASLTDPMFGQDRYRGRDESRHDGHRHDGDRHDRHRGRDPNGFGKRAHVEALANRLEKQSSAICLEMHRYYQRNANFKANYKSMYEIYQGANRIAELANNGSYRRPQSEEKLARDLHQLDRAFDRIDAEVRTWRPSRRDNSRGRDLAGLMDECEDTLDHLMDDYGVRSKVRKGNSRYGGRSRENNHTPHR
jgi:hypothetical protein